MKKIQLFLSIFIILFQFSTSIKGQSNKETLKEYLKTASNDKKITVLKLLSEIYLSEKSDSAIYYIEQIFKIEKKQNLGDSTLIDLYNMLGEAYYYKSNLRKSIKNFENALDILEKTADQQTFIKLFFNLGTISKELGKNKKAEEYYLKSVKIAEQNTSYQNIKQIYEALAQVYELEGECKKALTYFKKYNAERDKALNITTEKK